MKSLLLIVLLSTLMTSCMTAPKSIKEQRKEDVFKCIKELIENQVKALDAFEICRQINEMKKVDDNR